MNIDFSYLKTVMTTFSEINFNLIIKMENKSLLASLNLNKTSLDNGY